MSHTFLRCLAVAAASVGCLSFVSESSLPTTVEISLDQKQIGMGQSVTVRAQAKRADSEPAADCELLPYVTGHRRGAHSRLR